MTSRRLRQRGLPHRICPGGSCRASGNDGRVALTQLASGRRLRSSLEPNDCRAGGCVLNPSTATRELRCQSASDRRQRDRLRRSASVARRLPASAEPDCEMHVVVPTHLTRLQSLCSDLDQPRADVYDRLGRHPRRHDRARTVSHRPVLETRRPTARRRGRPSPNPTSSTPSCRAPPSPESTEWRRTDSSIADAARTVPSRSRRARPPATAPSPDPSPPETTGRQMPRLIARPSPLPVSTELGSGKPVAQFRPAVGPAPPASEAEVSGRICRRWR